MSALRLEIFTDAVGQRQREGSQGMNGECTFVLASMPRTAWLLPKAQCRAALPWLPFSRACRASQQRRLTPAMTLFEQHGLCQPSNAHLGPTNFV